MKQMMLGIDPIQDRASCSLSISPIRRDRLLRLMAGAIAAVYRAQRKKTQDHDEEPGMSVREGGSDNIEQ